MAFHVAVTLKIREGVDKYDGQGEVYKMMCSNLQGLVHFFHWGWFHDNAGSTTMFPLHDIIRVCMGLLHFKEPALI